VISFGIAAAVLQLSFILKGEAIAGYERRNRFLT
jgi:hypothetical protein